MGTDADAVWDVVAAVESEEEAEMMVGFLQARGVDARMDSAHSHEFPATVGVLGVVRIEVPAGQGAEAQQALAEHSGVEMAADQDPEMGVSGTAAPGGGPEAL